MKLKVRSLIIPPVSRAVMITPMDVVTKGDNFESLLPFSKPHPVFFSVTKEGERYSGAPTEVNFAGKVLLSSTESDPTHFNAHFHGHSHNPGKGLLSIVYGGEWQGSTFEGHASIQLDQGSNREAVEFTFMEEWLLPKTLENFKTYVTSKTSYQEIATLFGEPDFDVGSGMHIFSYLLNDGSTVRVSFEGLEKVFNDPTVIDAKGHTFHLWK